MSVFVWILQAVLAIFFLAPAYMKMTTPKSKLLEKGQLQPGGSVLPIRFIGIMELLGSVGIILPRLLNIVPVLTPIAAVGFCVVLVGAFAVHFSKKEYKVLPVIVVAFVLSAIVAIYLFNQPVQDSLTS